ncbi:MAG TPA: glycosyltransferase [Bryobacteraceae bacterium]|nr:glycosyltransferase [Bryobacteraceae bacterium]
MTGIDLPRSNKPRASVIIPATSTPELLLACLRSLARNGPRDLPYETIVVLNNASRDDERQLRETVTGLQVVGSRVNLGLAGAGNRGRQLARGEFLVLLHDDAEVEPAWLETLVETADAHPEAGAIGGMVLFPDGRLQHAGMILWRDAQSSVPWVGKTPAPTAYACLRAVDFCGTSSLLVRAAAWDAIGGLDERFYPVYYVDVDLAMALRRLGFVVVYQSRSCIRHHKGASTTRRFAYFLYLRNRRLFVEKWGAALEEHEPFAKDSHEAIERASARAASFQPPPMAATGPPPACPPFDSALQERRHRKKSRALQRAYAMYLAASFRAAVDVVELFQ